MSLKHNEEFKYALKDIANNSFKLENEFGNYSTIHYKPNDCHCIYIYE